MKRKYITLLLLIVLLASGCDKKKEEETTKNQIPENAIIISNDTEWATIKETLSDTLTQKSNINGYEFSSPSALDKEAENVLVFKDDKYLFVVSLAEEKAFESAKAILKDEYKITSVPSSKTGSITYNGKTYKYVSSTESKGITDEYILFINIGSIDDTEVNEFIKNIESSIKFNVNDGFMDE